MNPWLITWEPGDQAPRNPIAAIVHNNTSVERVCQIMTLLHANHVALGTDRVRPSEQVKYAQRKYNCNVRVGQFDRIFSQGSPELFARHVYNLRSIAKEDGYELLTWEDGIYPEVTQNTTDSEIARHFNRKKRRPRTRLRMVFDTQTLTITMGEWIVDPCPSAGKQTTPKARAPSEARRTRALQPTCYPYDYSTVVEDGKLIRSSSCTGMLARG